MSLENEIANVADSYTAQLLLLHSLPNLDGLGGNFAAETVVEFPCRVTCTTVLSTEKTASFLGAAMHPYVKILTRKIRNLRIGQGKDTLYLCAVAIEKNCIALQKTALQKILTLPIHYFRIARSYLQSNWS